MKIAHISSVHAAGDPRIRLKQIASLTDAGLAVTFVTGDMRAESTGAERIVKVWPGNGSRMARMLLTSPRCMLHARRLKADVYHFHDPELLMWSWMLGRSAAVVYDIHEDYSTMIQLKTWLPRRGRPILARILETIEDFAASRHHQVIAERYYQRRFPAAVQILNYARVSEADLALDCFSPAGDLLYTGNVSVNRGALQLAQMVAASPDIRVSVVGRCGSQLAQAMRLKSGNSDRLTLIGVDRYVPHAELRAHYARGNCLAGVAVFPDNAGYREKELTKFFEYMAFGLPIIASDFPVWKQLIEDQKVGLCVPPDRPEAAIEAVRWLRSNPGEARAMGERGRQLVRDRYNWDRQAARLLEFYRSIGGASAQRRTWPGR